MFKFIDLLSSNNVCLLQKLGSFIEYAFKVRSDTLYIRHWPIVYILIFHLLCIIIMCTLLPSAICVCEYCKIAAKVNDLLKCYCDRPLSGVVHRASTCSHQHFFRNRFLNSDQTSQEWSLCGPLPMLLKRFQVGCISTRCCVKKKVSNLFWTSKSRAFIYVFNIV